MRPDAEISIKHLSAGDVKIAEQLFLLFQRVFEVENSTEVGRAYLEALLNNANFICFSAFSENKVVGGLTAYALPKYDKESSEIFIYDIAVEPDFQRMGTGKKLISAIKGYGIDNGIKEIFVDAHRVDEHAIKFYRSLNSREDAVIQFTFAV